MQYSEFFTYCSTFANTIMNVMGRIVKIDILYKFINVMLMKMMRMMMGMM